jgi:hypothetical protein
MSSLMQYKLSKDKVQLQAMKFSGKLPIILATRSLHAAANSLKLSDHVAEQSHDSSSLNNKMLFMT